MTIFKLLIPENTAVCVNSLSLKVKICDLYLFDGGAQSKIPSKKPNPTKLSCPLSMDAIKITKGRRGITIILSTIVEAILSKVPPM